MHIFSDYLYCLQDESTTYCVSFKYSNIHSRSPPGVFGISIFQISRLRRITYMYFDLVETGKRM